MNERFIVDYQRMTGIEFRYGIKVGKNVNLHKGCTIGRENRSSRVGYPTIANCLYAGINDAVVRNTL